MAKSDTPKLTFFDSDTFESQEALKSLRDEYGDVGIDAADIAVVAAAD